MNKSIKDRILNINPIKLFIALSLLSYIMYLTYNVLFGASETTYSWLGLYGDTDAPLDFWIHVRSTQSLSRVYIDSYRDSSCFPPLSYIFYWFINMVGKSPDNYSDVLSRDLFITHGYVHVYIYLTIFTVIIWLIGIFRLDKNNNYKLNITLVIVLVLSIEMYGSAILIGNSVSLVGGLLLIAYTMKDSDKKYEREMALWLMAICVNFKLYPAIFIMFYIYDKKYKEAIKLIVYTTVLFIVPFIWLGGIEGFKSYIHILSMLNNYDSIGFISNIQDVTRLVLRYFNETEYNTIYKVVAIAFLIIRVALAGKTQNKYIRTYLICSLMTLFLNKSFRYTLVYLFIPLMHCIIDNYKSGLTLRNKYVSIIMILASLSVQIPIIFGIMTGFVEHIELTTLYNSIIKIPSIDIAIYIPLWTIDVMICGYVLAEVRKIHGEVKQ